MKTLFVIIIAFIIGFFSCYLFFSNQKTQPKTHEDCWGYSIHTDTLQKFMRDSLVTDNFQFSGGVLLKSVLQKMIDSSSGDLVRVLIANYALGKKYQPAIYVTGNSGGLYASPLDDTSIIKTPCCWTMPSCCPGHSVETFVQRVNPYKLKYFPLPDSIFQY